MKDRIIMQGLELHGYHGVLDAERELGQPFLIDLELFLDLRPAGRRDDLALTVDYSAVYAVVKKAFQARRYRLIEAVAEAVAQAVLSEFPVREVRVQVRKPHAPVRGKFKYFAVEITRSKRWLKRCEKAGLNPATAYIGLGSNQGDRSANLERALRELAAGPGIEVRRTASVYETAPVGRTDQGWFLNTVAEIETTLEPRALLTRLQRIETRLGRVRKERWGPRVIDLDLLLYGDLVLDEPGLQVPHPRLTERAFAVVPLAEIVPELTLPGRRRAADLARQLAREQEIHRCTES